MSLLNEYEYEYGHEYVKDTIFTIWVVGKQRNNIFIEPYAKRIAFQGLAAMKSFAFLKQFPRRSCHFMKGKNRIQCALFNPFAHHQHISPHLLRKSISQQTPGPGPELASTLALGCESDQFQVVENTAGCLKMLKQVKSSCERQAANFFISKKTIYSIIHVFDICFWSSRRFGGEFESH